MNLRVSSGFVPLELPSQPAAKHVRAVQSALNRLLPEAHLAEDGLLGPRTQAALGAFQQLTGLAPTGALDAETLEALNQSLLAGKVLRLVGEPHRECLPPATLATKSRAPESPAPSPPRGQPIDDLQLAKIAGAAYGDSDLPPGTSRAGRADLRRLGLDARMFEDPVSGLQAALFVQEGGGYVLAFAGTNPLDVGDWQANLDNAVGRLSVQHRQAVQLARSVQAKLAGAPLILTGHSLGGGLASAAAVATGTPAVTFNAAGHVEEQRLLELGVNHQALSRSHELVRAYYTEDDPLSFVQLAVPFLSRASGKSIRIDSPLDGPHVARALAGDRYSHGHTIDHVHHSLEAHLREQRTIEALDRRRP